MFSSLGEDNLIDNMMAFQRIDTQKGRNDGKVYCMFSFINQYLFSLKNYSSVRSIRLQPVIIEFLPKINLRFSQCYATNFYKNTSLSDMVIALDLDL